MKKPKLKKIINYILSIILIIFIAVFSSPEDIIKKQPVSTIIYNDKTPHEESFFYYNRANITDIPANYLYTAFYHDELKNWLSSKNSLLAEEPYFSSIIEAAKKYNLNPSLLFAITGAEQSFVPKSNPHAIKIANNPFNVFGSWEKYNTNAKNAAEIACKTILKISKNRPKDKHFLKWINSKNGTGGYAEDPDWWENVDNIFKKITSEIHS